MKFCNPKKQQENYIKGCVYTDNDMIINGYTTIDNSTSMLGSYTMTNLENGIINQAYRDAVTSANTDAAFNQIHTLDRDPINYVVYMTSSQYADWQNVINNDINNNLNTI